MNYLRIAPARSAALFGLALSSAALSFGQTSARIEGRATDGAGRPVSNAVVRLVTDTTAHTNNTHPWRYTLVGDSLGKYSQEGIAPGAYLVMLFTDGKGTSISKSVILKAGDSSVINLVSEPALQLAGVTGEAPGAEPPLRRAAQTR